MRTFPFFCYSIIATKRAFRSLRLKIEIERIGALDDFRFETGSLDAVVFRGNDASVFGYGNVVAFVVLVRFSRLDFFEAGETHQIFSGGGAGVGGAKERLEFVNAVGVGQTGSFVTAGTVGGRKENGRVGERLSVQSNLAGNAFGLDFLAAAGGNERYERDEKKNDRKFFNHSF